MPLPTDTPRGFTIRRLPRAVLLGFTWIGAMLLASGCGQTNGGTAGGGSAASSGFGTDATVIASVNKDPITQSELYDELQRYVPARLPQYPNNPGLNEPAGRFILQQLITNKIVLQAAGDQKVPVTPEEVDARYNDIKMIREAQGTQTFEKFLEAQGYTADSYKQSTIVPEVAQYNLLTHGLTGTPQELQAYYNSHQTNYTEPQCAHIERVTFPTQAAAQQAFATASKEKSLSSIIPPNTPTPDGAANPADIPQWIGVDSAPPAIKPLISQVVKSSPGAILAPMQVQGQWWVTGVVAVKPKTILTYDQVKHIIEWQVMTQKAQTSGNVTTYQETVRKAQQNAQVQINAPQYQTLAQQIRSESAVPGGQP